ncbi:MAG: F0F1 ATP synthase subunit epsilon [Clostridia bacterium]|nr:F0F1 ATP synthase subunit epsilon [Clostridia bacterium]
MSAFSLVVSTPNGDVFRGEATVLSVRGVEGELAVMAHHVPFVTAIKAGSCKIELEDETVKLGHTDGGILTVAKDKVTLLAGSFTWTNLE